MVHLPVVESFNKCDVYMDWVVRIGDSSDCCGFNVNFSLPGLPLGFVSRNIQISVLWDISVHQINEGSVRPRNRQLLIFKQL